MRKWRGESVRTVRVWRGEGVRQIIALWGCDL